MTSSPCVLALLCRGILNGIDTGVWDPATDVFLPPAMRFTVQSSLAGKAAAKSELQRRLGLPQSSSAPLVGFVGRLDMQKGVDVVFSAAPQLLGPPCGSMPHQARARPHEPAMQLVMLGAGEGWMERGLEGLERSYPGRAAGIAGFDEAAAHLLMAASDFLVGAACRGTCALVLVLLIPLFIITTSSTSTLTTLTTTTINAVLITIKKLFTFTRAMQCGIV